MTPQPQCCAGVGKHLGPPTRRNGARNVSCFPNFDDVTAARREKHGLSSHARRRGIQRNGVGGTMRSGRTLRTLMIGATSALLGLVVMVAVPPSAVAKKAAPEVLYV